MKYIFLFVILMACQERTVIEPRYCWTCHETNSAVKGNAATIGDAFTDFCSKTPTEIADIEAQSFERILSDSTKLTHQIRCTKSEKQ